MHEQCAPIKAFPLSPASAMMHHVIELQDYRVGIKIDAQVDQLVEGMNPLLC